jgi:hypothetical protein
MKRKTLEFDPTAGEFIRSKNPNRLLPYVDWRSLQAPNAVENVVNSDADIEVYPLANGAAPHIINSTFDRSSGLLNSPNPFI